MPVTQWGEWTYEPDGMMLVLGEGVARLALRDATSSAQLLDWIVQIAKKSWATNDTVGDLVQALNDLLNPQARLCSMGQDKRISDVRGLLTRQGYDVPSAA